MARNPLVRAAWVCVLAGSSVAAQQKSLQPDAPIEASLGPKESHEYVVTSRANQAFDIVAEQRGLDIVLTVIGPTGEPLMQVDGAADDQGRGGSEVAHVRAVEAGNYRVRIALFDRPDHKPGKYNVTLTAVRDLTAEEASNAKSERDITAIEVRWEKAVDNADVPTMDSILRSDAFALGPYASSSRTRKQVLDGWASTAEESAKRGATRTHTIAEHAIRAAGDMAVSTGRFLLTTTVKDGEAKYSGQFVHVWGRDKTGWKLVADYSLPFGRTPRPAGTPASVPLAALSPCVGTYRFEQDNTFIDIKVDGANLVAQWHVPVQEPFTVPLAAATQTTFYGPNESEYVFVRTADGNVRELLILGDGPATRAIRQRVAH